MAEPANFGGLVGNVACDLNLTDHSHTVEEEKELLFGGVDARWEHVGFELVGLVCRQIDFYGRKIVKQSAADRFLKLL